MFFDLLFQFLDPSQVFTSVAVAVISIVIRQSLPAILAFLANLLVLFALFAIFLLSLFVLTSLPPLP